MYSRKSGKFLNKIEEVHKKCAFPLSFFAVLH